MEPQVSIAEQIIGLRAGANTTATAAGTGDNTEIVGTTFDLQTYGYPKSAAVLINFTTTLAASKTLTIKNFAFEHGSASNMSDTADLSAPADIVAATDSGSGSTLTGVVKYNVNLQGAKRYVRITYTPDLNATGTDTANVGAMIILANPQILPQSQPAAA